MKTPIITAMSVNNRANGVVICINETLWEMEVSVWLRQYRGPHDEYNDIAPEHKLLSGLDVATRKTTSIFAEDLVVFWEGGDIDREVVAVYGPEGAMSLPNADITNYRLVKPFLPSDETVLWTNDRALPTVKAHGKVLTTEYLSGGE